MSSFFVYRNCFTGEVSGGDMHTGGFCAWLRHHRPALPLAMVHAAGDGQEQAYADVAEVPQITYRAPELDKPVALLYVLRALKGANVPLPLHGTEQPAFLIAGSHFLPDVWPVYRQGRGNPAVQRVVYIHHIVQDMPRPAGLNTWLANMQERFCFWLIKRRFDSIITVNQDVVESLRRRGFRQPILVSSNFVQRKAAAQPLAFAQKDITLAFCGRMVRQKGVDDFVALCAQLQATVPDFRAVMIGVGPELERLKAEAEAQALNIIFAGRVNDDEKFEYLRRAKLFVFPSREEGWGIVIAESLSVGTPVLAYDLPVYGPIFGPRVHVVPVGDEGRLRRAALRLLGTYGANPSLYEQDQTALAAFASQFTLDNVVSKEYAFITEGAQL